MPSQRPLAAPIDPIYQENSTFAVIEIISSLVLKLILIAPLLLVILLILILVLLLVVVVVVIVVLLLLLLFQKFQKSNAHAHKLDWCVCALDGVKNVTDQRTNKAFLGVGLGYKV